MSKGLTPGATLPDFELPDYTGTKYRLSQLQGEDPMVLGVCGVLVLGPALVLPALAGPR